MNESDALGVWTQWSLLTPFFTRAMPLSRAVQRSSGKLEAQVFSLTVPITTHPLPRDAYQDFKNRSFVRLMVLNCSAVNKSLLNYSAMQRG